MKRFPAASLFLILTSVSIGLFQHPAYGSKGESSSTSTPEVKLNDVRMKKLKDLNGHFPFKVPETPEAWEKRAEMLRKRILVTNGLWPMPERTPLNPVIHGRIERDGFTVEKVYFESHPGFYVTGMLFRPLGKQGPFPAVLAPHGHGGRLQMADAKKIQSQIEKGEERFAASGSVPKLALCAQLARMGVVTFMHDMIGYADSKQIRSAVAHGDIKNPPELDSPELWDFHSTQAELRVQNIFGLQTWNSIRSLDFLESLPDVDKTRIGVTGGSGGGTQTIILAAIDPRPVVVFPQGMVSTSMQGGCVCENTSLLRIQSGNVELAALFAPRPQAMSTANDWTKNMMKDGFPELKQLYTMLGHPENVECTDLPQFPHNFNYVTRALMYEWFNKHLNLGLESPIIEEDWELLAEKTSDPAYHVWNKEHPVPKLRGAEFERKFLRELSDRSDAQIQSLWPVNATAAEVYRETIGTAVKALIGRTLEDVGPVQQKEISSENRGHFVEKHSLLNIVNHGEQLPVVTLSPVGSASSGRTVLWLTGSGIAGLYQSEGVPVEAVQKLLSQGVTVIAADLFAQGKFVSESLSGDTNRTVEKSTSFAGYTYTYNNPLFIQRTHDVLSLVQMIRSDKSDVTELTLVGTDGIGPVVAAAGAVCGRGIDRLAVESNGFRFTNLKSFRDADFIPGITKYGDLPALLALNAPTPLLVIGDDESQAEVARLAYKAANSNIFWQQESNKPHNDVVKWLAP